MLKLNTAAFCTLLKKVHLGGIINECVLTIQGGNAVIQAIDMTNCLYVSVSTIVGPEETDIPPLGLTDIGTIIRLLETIDSEQITASVKENKWMRMRLRGRGMTTFLLTDPEMIPTAVSADNDVSKSLLKGAPYKLKITQEAKDNFLYFMGILKSKSIVVTAVKNSIQIGSGPNETQQFTSSLGKIKSVQSVPDFSTIIYGEHLVPVLEVLSYEEDAQDVVVYFGTENPMIITQDDNLWALTPAEA